MKTKFLYPAPAEINIGDLQDNDPPVFEIVEEYLVPNARINANGYIFKNFRPIKQAISFRHRDSVTIKNIVSHYLLKKQVEVNEPAISIMSGWNDNFYHLTLESLPKLFVLREHIEQSTIVFPKELKQFHREWIELLELKNITYIGDNEVVKTPLAISSTFTSRDLNHHNLVIPEFRSWILDRVDNEKTTGYEKIFIGRKSPSKRNIVNIEEVKAEVKRCGFTYIEMESYNLREQINIFRNAKKIVAIHGAALSHLCFADPNIKVLDLIHADYKVFCFLKLSRILGIDYSLLFCDGVKVHNALPGYQDVIVDVGILKDRIKTW